MKALNKGPMQCCSRFRFFIEEIIDLLRLLLCPVIWLRTVNRSTLQESFKTADVLDCLTLYSMEMSLVVPPRKEEEEKKPLSRSLFDGERSIVYHSMLKN